MSDMREVILSSPDQITHSMEVNKDVTVEGDFDAIILAGMGGSGHPGDLLNALGLMNVPLYVHRNYDLPTDYLSHMGFKNPLVITSSYSGNTEEALSAYEAAQREGLQLMVSTSGGTLEEWAQRDNVPMAKIDYQDMQPRHTLFAAAVGIMTVLANSGLAENASDELTRAATAVKDATPSLEEPAQETAQAIKGKVPVFTSADPLGFAAKNFKIQCNENAKHPAFWNTFPELNHNELLGFSKLKEQQNPNEFFVLMLRNEDDHPRNKARMDITAQLYEEWGATVQHVEAKGDSLMEKIFYAVQFGMWTTYHLANEYGIDPVPVEGVESFKQKLKEAAQY